MEIVQNAQKNVFEGIIMTKGHWDQSRKFKIFEHVFTGSHFEILSQEYNVTLVTQSSFDRLYSLTEVSVFVAHIRNHIFESGSEMANVLYRVLNKFSDTLDMTIVDIWLI